jgi:hypothetical protein
MDITQKILGKRVVRICHNYIEKSLVIYFDGDMIVQFYECAIVFDLGVIGHIITYASLTSTLGMTFELKKFKQDPDDYNFIIISRDIKDYENKNEMIISFKECKLTQSPI